MTHTWRYRALLPERHGQACEVTASARKGDGIICPQIINPPTPKSMGTIRVRFADGFEVVTSRYAVRKGT